MLPTLTERDIEEGMRSFIEREFPIATPAFRPGGESLVDAYVEARGEFMKGPWLEIRRPFRTLPADMAALFPFLSGKYGVSAHWVPYAHQKRAFERLAFPDPKSTLIATGTGSGKTECFLLPVLDAVLRMNAQKIPGIKALVIYPMNALAADQARRFARLCREIADRGGPQLSVGLYVGSPGERSGSMGWETCITDRKVLRANPTDVLLTNYKMLDFLLLRREDRALWRGTSAKSLRYLVVDELHTFDGAQGTDLACLVRRLRDFAGLGKELACVGTSATLGGGSDTLALRRYAEDVFGTDFSDEGSVIREDRLSPTEYLETFETTRFEGQWPKPYVFRTSFKTISKSAEPESFMQGAFRLWFGYRSIPKGDKQSWERAALDLGRMLPKLEAFRRLMSEEDAVLSLDRLATDWRRDIEAVKGYTQEEAVLLIRSLVALVSMARLGEPGKTRPFLTVRVELWVRELARMLATLEPRPRLIAEADRDDRTPPALPLVTCRDCNATGWGGVTLDLGKIDTSPEKFYTHFFAFEPDVAIFYPVDEKELRDVRKRFGKELRYINLKDPRGPALEWVGEDLTEKEVLAKTQPNEEGRVERLLVRMPDIVKSTRTADGRDVRRSTACPCCGGENTLRLFGARAAPLASALFSHLTASTTNDDHKLIAFSDSVQDAAHRSGFIEARSYFYCVRQAAAGMVREVREGEARTLEDLLLRLTDHWVDVVGERGRLRQEDPKRAEDIASARFAATFVPSDMLWRASWIDFVRGLSKPSGIPYGEIPALFEDEAQKTRTPWGRFVEDVKARLRWEVFVEFTFRARSGRSIEMAGIGAVVPDLGLVREAAPRLRDKVVERVGGLSGQPVEVFERFITGFLEHQKSRGAFDLSGVPGLGDFMRFVETGEDWIFNRSLTLPTYGKKFRPPAPLVMRPLRGEKKRFFDAVLPGETWHTLWLTQIFGAGLDVAAGAEDIYGALFEVLEDVGLIRSIWMKTQENTRVFLLNPQTWFAARRLRRAVCPVCGRWHTVSADEEAEALWSAMPCLSQGCLGGRHTIEPFDGETDLYAGRPRRAVSREHSGDVEGKERARIERSFIHGQEPWEVNLLSATPTLEMGIDIGDLSSVLLACVPPKVANYQQRVGRAGRRDGNALALTLAGTSAHARYFWADPEKMIAGEVDPPGVFLHATAVLERQLFALALTRWMTFYPAAKLPPTIGAILKSQEMKAGRRLPESFPLGFLDYAKSSSETLLRDFALLFPAGFDGDAAHVSLFSENEKERLRVFLTGDGEGLPSLRDRLLGKIESLGRAREHALKRKEAYQQALKIRKKDPADETRENDIRELEGNIRALSDLIADEYDQKQTLNVLTDEGLLPNYAFPEEGITIEGLVVSLRNRGGGKAEEKNIEEPEEKDKTGAAEQSQKTKKGGVYKRLTFQRAASSGLLEVAPENTFFTNDYVLHVDQVELVDEGVRTWRFCPACHHSALEFSDEQSSACPCCGSAAWKDVSQKRQVLQLRSVYAWADVRRDRIRDDVESRRAVRQVRKLLLDIAPDAARRCFTVEGGSGFAFEYLSSVTLRDFNFGPAGREEGDIEVAGEKLKAPGFVVCASCGRVKKKTGGGGRPQHDFHCKYFKTPEAAEWIEGLILFREFTSEALRIRLPGGELAAHYSTQEISASISAALTLGLKQYFHGSVDHLRLAEVEEPVRAGEGKRRSVVVYDTVPGGTGYLKELMDDSKKLLGLFRMALDAMTACPCGGDPLARGCYQCVYQYGNQAQRESISKYCAMELVNDLLSKPVVETKPGADEAPQGEVESELEAEFIRALRGSDLVTDMKRCQGGLPFCLIRMASGRLWRMDLQEDARGEVPSRPDFVLRPSKEGERGPGLEMAVFTDGWRYHAGIVADDCAKRQSLLNRGTLVWTLTWEDIRAAREKASDIPGVPLFIRPFTPGSALSKKAYAAWVRQLKERFGREGYPAAAELADVWGSAKKTSLDRLLLWMNDPEKASRAAEAAAYVRALQCVMTDDLRPVAGGRVRLAGPLAEALSATSDTKPHAFGVDRSETGWSAVHDAAACRSAFFADPDHFKAHGEEPASAQAARSLRAFWTAVNNAVLAERTVIVPSALSTGGSGPDVLQTPPWSRALEEGAASPARLFTKDFEASSGEALAERWKEAKVLLPDMLQPLASALEKRGVPIELENIGVEVADEEGAVSVLYEFWWPEAKLAILFRPETAPAGITALDAGGDPEETAREAARKLGAKGGAS